MATPHVAGVAALAWAIDPNATVPQVRDAILNGVDHIASLSGQSRHRRTAQRPRRAGATRHARGEQHAGRRATVTNPPLNFTIDFSANIAAATVQAADFRVNGIAANNYTIVDANTITFRFNSSPVTAQGPQTMQIAAGAIGRAGSGVGFSGWQATFNYDQTAMAVVSTTPDENATLTSTPTALTFTLNEAVNAASVSASDLVLSSGTVTGATLVNATTVRYTISLPTFEGPLTYTLARGALTDAYGNPSAAYTGHVTVDDPSIVRYQASGLPLAIPDQGTITSTLTINDNYLISDLDVELTLGHTWNDDLDVYLIAPDGTRIELFTDVGGSGQGFTGTILDDQATQGIASGTAPFTGRFRPEGLLSAVNGKRTAGTWRLEVSDDYEWDTGAITAWSLQFRVVRGPSLAAVPDQSTEHNSGAWTRQLVVSNPSGNPLNYSVTVTGLAIDPAYTLDQQLGLWADPARCRQLLFQRDGRQREVGPRRQRHLLRTVSQRRGPALRRQLREHHAGRGRARHALLRQSAVADQCPADPSGRRGGGRRLGAAHRHAARRFRGRHPRPCGRLRRRPERHQESHAARDQSARATGGAGRSDGCTQCHAVDGTTGGHISIAFAAGLATLSRSFVYFWIESFERRIYKKSTGESW